MTASPAVRAAPTWVYTTLPNDKSFTVWFSMAPLREPVTVGQCLDDSDPDRQFVGCLA